jgi:prepilin-type N-terminal cleavage/methylation domain-containing protein
MRARRSGFTLIELLIVLVLLGILATVGLSRFWVAKDRALVAAMKGDLRTLASQQELYFEGSFRYASAVTDLHAFQLSPGVDINITYAENDGWGAIASHPSLATEVCAFFYGDVPVALVAPATTSGVINCQD